MKLSALAIIFISCCWVAQSLAETFPMLELVSVSANHIQNGGSVTVTVIAVSESPVNWVNRSLDGPHGNIYGGGAGVLWTNLGDDRWQYEWTDVISSWAPSGEYVYSTISCENEAQLESDTWPNIYLWAKNRMIETVTAAEAAVSIQFPTESDKLFSVQHSTSLNPPDWMTLETIVGTGESITHTNTMNLGGGYFRVIMQE
jgi:hypothetical protein